MFPEIPSSSSFGVSLGHNAYEFHICSPNWKKVPTQDDLEALWKIPNEIGFDAILEIS